MRRAPHLTVALLVLLNSGCRLDESTGSTPLVSDVSLAKGQPSYTWSFNGDVQSDPAHPAASTLSDVYLVFPATTSGNLAACDAKSQMGPTSNDWGAYSGAAWRGNVTLQKKGQSWHFSFQATQQDGDGGYLNLAVNDAATENNSNGVVTVTFTNSVGLVSALSHAGGAADPVDRCLTFSVVKAPA